MQCVVGKTGILRGYSITSQTIMQKEKNVFAFLRRTGILNIYA